MIRLLALDVDGTLAQRGDEVSPATRRALHRAHEAGVEIVIATGRRYRTTRRAMASLGLELAAVSLGGALVKERDGRTLLRRALCAPDLREAAALFREQGLTPIGQRDGHADDGPDFVIDGALPWNPWTARYAEANREHLEWCRDLAVADRDDVIEVCGFGPEAEIAALVARVEERHPGRFSCQLMPLPSREGFFAGVRPAGICKWSGLGRLLEDRGIDAGAVCAVGDERNDLSMVMAAGWGVAMGNAHGALREVADWVTGRHDEDGLVAVVERILDLG